MQLVRAGHDWRSNGVVSETEVMMAREPAALIGAAPAIENSMRRIPLKQTTGGSFGNPRGLPNINTIRWRTYGGELR